MMTHQVFLPTARTSELYLHHPIDEQSRQIRLLSLLPGDFDNDINCDIRTVDLDLEDLEYETLSYTWGDPNITVSISIGGHQLEITTNLSLALRHLRLKDKPLVIWADAICINQRDNSEKSHQVGLMSVIYRECTRVYLWLGCGDDDSFNPFALFELLSENKHYYEVSESQRKRSELEVAAILHSPWWTRIWTVQEAVLPPSALLVYGHWSMEWDTLFQSLETYSRHRFTCCKDVWKFEFHFPIATLRSHVSSVQYTRTAGRWGIENLHYLLLRLGQRVATDPKDKIIGFLGLLDTRDLSREEKSYLDYNHPTSTIYLQYFSLMLEYGFAGFRCLLGSTFNSPHQEDLCLPSWVPNFAQGISVGNSFCELARFGRYECYDASAGRTRDFLVKDSHLHILGYAHDEIDSIYDITQPNSLWNFLESSDLVGGIEDRENYLRTLTGNLRLALAKDGNIRLGTVAESEKEVITTQELALVEEYLNLQPPYNLSRIQDDIQMVLRWQRIGRLFFLTKNNTMGLCEPGTEVGDKVCIFYGGNVPFIIRKSFVDTNTTPETQAYDFIGDCYLQGFMHGEALEGPSFDAKNEEDFWFRGSHCSPDGTEEV